MSKIILVEATLVGIGAVVAINKNEEAKEKEAAEQAAKKASEQAAKDVIKLYDTALVHRPRLSATTCVRMMFNCKMLIAVYPW